MDFETKERLARTGDTTPDAIGRRLRAARVITGLSQKDFAALLDLKPQTYNSQEKRGAPSIDVMQHLYRAHRVDFNFILHGDFAQLPGDVQDELFAALFDGTPS
jgi:transcriptional regulator with XRE-family HTH domain